MGRDVGATAVSPYNWGERHGQVSDESQRPRRAQKHHARLVGPPAIVHFMHSALPPKSPLVGDRWAVQGEQETNPDLWLLMAESVRRCGGGTH